MKSRSKTKMCRNTNSINRTGGGSSKIEVITPIEDEILSLISPTATNGIPGTSETTVGDTELVEAQCAIILSDDDSVENEADANIILKNIEREHDYISKAPSTSVQQQTHCENQRTKNTKKRCRSSTQRLENATNVAGNMTSATQQRTQILQNYYNKKLELLEIIATAQERKARATERIASALEGGISFS